MKIKELLSVYTLRITAISTLLSACLFAPVLLAIKCEGCGQEIEHVPKYCAPCTAQHIRDRLGDNLLNFRNFADTYHDDMASGGGAEAELPSPSPIFIVVTIPTQNESPGQRGFTSPEPRWDDVTPDSTPSPTNDQPPDFNQPPSGLSSQDIRYNRRRSSLRQVFTIPSDQQPSDISVLTHISEIDHSQYVKLFEEFIPHLHNLIDLHDFGSPSAPNRVAPVDEGYQLYQALMPPNSEPQGAGIAEDSSYRGLTQAVSVGDRRHLQERSIAERHNLDDTLGVLLSRGRVLAVRFANENINVLMAFEGTQPDDPGDSIISSTVRIPLLGRNYQNINHANVIALVEGVMDFMGVSTLDTSELLTEQELDQEKEKEKEKEKQETDAGERRMNQPDPTATATHSAVTYHASPNSTAPAAQEGEPEPEPEPEPEHFLVDLFNQMPISKPQ